MPRTARACVKNFSARGLPICARPPCARPFAWPGAARSLLCGNGGSAADAQHLAAEFVNRFLMDRPALPALALSTDTSALTAIGTDLDFSQIFARQVEALGRKG